MRSQQSFTAKANAKSHALAYTFMKSKIYGSRMFQSILSIMSIFINKRKNGQFREGHTSFIAKFNKATCPVRITEQLSELLLRSLIIVIHYSHSAALLRPSGALQQWLCKYQINFLVPNSNFGFNHILQGECFSNFNKPTLFKIRKW